MRFLRLNKIVRDAEFDYDDVIEKMDSMASDLEWIKAEYARDLFWIKERFFYDVETPNEEVSLTEYQTEEGQKKYWNKRLTELISDYENDTLFSRILDDYFKCVLVIPNENDDLYLRIDEKILPLIDCIDVTDEYEEIIKYKIDKTEIENFVKNHTQDEVEKKYHVFGWRNEFWVL